MALSKDNSPLHAVIWREFKDLPHDYIYHLVTRRFIGGLRGRPTPHIYHPSSGLHLNIDVRSGRMIDVSTWGGLSPADKAAGYKMLYVVGGNT